MSPLTVTLRKSLNLFVPPSLWYKTRIMILILPDKREVLVFAKPQRSSDKINYCRIVNIKKPLLYSALLISRYVPVFHYKSFIMIL